MTVLAGIRVDRMQPRVARARDHERRSAPLVGVGREKVATHDVPPARCCRRWSAATTARPSSPQGGRARVRLAVVGGDAWDAVLNGGTARLVPAEGDADATLTADPTTWTAIADDVRGGMGAYQSGRLAVRRNLHLGVGFLAATSGLTEPGRLRFRTVATRGARLSTLEAAAARRCVALHGLGGTKGSFLPTVAALAAAFASSPSTSPGSATPTSRSARPTTRASSPARSSTCSTRSSSSGCT